MSELYSPAERVGKCLAETLKNRTNFYFFSPDETTSNKFSAVFDVQKRAFNMPVKNDDLPSGQDGRIIEMLSENVLFSVMTGHLINGEPAMMGSYEAFFSVITSQLLQQIKFIKQSKKVGWRRPLPAVNLLSTSTCWRQDHNGFTHQSPALISQLLALPSDLTNCLFPADDVAAEEAYYYMLNATDVVNLTTFNKNPAPRFDDLDAEGMNLDEGGATLYTSISDENPDFVLTAAGDIATREAVEAMKILRADLPEIKLRFVGINVLSYRAIGTTERKLTQAEFDNLFTTNRPIIANFHGYPLTLESILENYAFYARLRVHGFYDEGSTTTPFEMLAKNAASRYDLAIDVATALHRDDLVQRYRGVLHENHVHAVNFGEDML